MDGIKWKAEKAELLSDLLTKENISTIYKVKNGTPAEELDSDNVLELAEENIVKKDSSDVQLTEKGELLYPAINQLLKNTHLERIDWLLDRVDNWEETLPPLELLSDSDISFQDTEQHLRNVVNRYNELVEESSTVKELSPFILGAGLESRHAVLPENTNALYIFSDEITWQINASEYHREALQEYSEDPDVELLQYNGELPYMLTVLDDKVLFIAKGNSPETVLLESDSDDLRTWAENKIEEYREEAEELQLDESVSPPKIQE